MRQVHTAGFSGSSGGKDLHFLAVRPGGDRDAYLMVLDSIPSPESLREMSVILSDLPEDVWERAKRDMLPLRTMRLEGRSPLVRIKRDSLNISHRLHLNHRV